MRTSQLLNVSFFVFIAADSIADGQPPQDQLATEYFV